MGHQPSLLKAVLPCWGAGEDTWSGAAGSGGSVWFFGQPSLGLPYLKSLAERLFFLSFQVGRARCFAKILKVVPSY